MEKTTAPPTVMDDERRLYLLMGIVTTIALTVGAIVIALLYRTALDQQRADLVKLAQTQTQLIDAMARFNARAGGGRRSAVPAEATLAQVRDAFESYEGFGESGGFVLARREGEDIVFLYLQRARGASNHPRRVPLAAGPEPMRRALLGESGNTVARDYRGVEVLAAYAPIRTLGLGLVAKMDMSEIRAPFVRAAFFSSVAIILGIVLGSWLYLRQTRPLVARLRENATNLAKAQEVAHLGNWSVDVTTGKVVWSDELYRIFGYEPGSRTPSYETYISHVHPEDRPRIVAAIAEARARGGPFTYTYRLRRADGVERIIESHGQTFTNSHGVVTRLFGVSQDVTERKAAEAQTRKLSYALEQTADAVAVTDRRGVIEYVNPAFEAMTGYGRAELVGRKLNMLRSGVQDEAFYRRLWDTILAGEVFREVFVNRRKDGSLYYEEESIAPLRDAEGNVSHFVATARDISERMQTQERLQHLAHHDALTGLPNRALFLDRLKQALARARWHGRLVAVIFLDLDRFKIINDTLGHDFGDQLLQQMSVRLLSSVRERDTVARLGGDEFAILLDDMASESDAGHVAQKVLEALVPRFHLGDRELYVSASLGISLYPNDGDDANTLLKYADTAMYRVKDSGKNNYQFYSADMSTQAFDRLTLESSLRRALERGEFRLHYQPQVDVRSGAVIGVEALLRWQHPEYSLIGPLQFIHLAEETGLILPMGEWVLATACEQLRAWHAAGWRDLRLAVNLSARQVGDPGLLRLLERVIGELGGAPGLLELEITESALLQQTRGAAANLEALHRLGVRLALDDFGTGHSSLSYLQRFPIDTIKIDRSFIRNLPDDAEGVVLTEAILGMARGLRIEVVAEGVETAAQRDFLLARGCHHMQGFLFGRAVPAGEIVRRSAPSAPPNG